MGRPELKKEDKKVQRTIRISPKTYLVLEEKAALYNGGNIGKYLSLVVDKAILGTTMSSSSHNSGLKNDLFTSIRELNKIGNNLNQLTKLAHQDRIFDSDLKVKLTQLDIEIKKLNLKIADLLSK
ncbi:MobC family plasmid mobilization relaxosome protein [Empedobacter falsenii]